MTTENGHFILSVPSAGSWRLTASAAGYVTQAYDAHGGFSSSVVLTDAAPSYDLIFRLPPQGRISGTVLDEAGEGVRNGTIELSMQPQAIPGQAHPVSTMRRMTTTDDRGVYEFSGLQPGDYSLRVRARPWYATGRSSSGGGQQAAISEPDLDVTYPPLWFPGVSEESEAQVLHMKPGDQQQADMQLTPLPAAHLQLLLSSADAGRGRGGIGAFPIVERIDGGMGQGFQQTTTTQTATGQLDIGGLSPGTYRISIPGGGGQGALVRVSGGTAQTVDLREPDGGGSHVSIVFDGDTEDRGSSVELVDATTGQRYGGAGPGSPFRGQRGPSQQQDRAIRVPPGRYEIVLHSRESYLIGIAAHGAAVAGRFVTLDEGEVTLTLHLASGQLTVTGVASMAHKPCAGAMVMLVPASLDDAGSFATVGRDQSNTDGSFEITGVVPGNYILMAVDHGWTINWSDPSTLRRYLIQGVPLVVRQGATLRQNLEAIKM